MRIPQFSTHAALKDKQWDFDELAQPYFQLGTSHPEVGCLLLHGIMGTAANVRVQADYLAKLGYTVYAPLLSGHGTTLGDMNACTKEDWIRDTIAGYDKLKAAGCTRIFAMGLSLGGLLCALLAAQRPIDGLVLICAPFKMQAYLHRSMLLRFFVSYAEFPKNEKQRLRHAPYNQMYNGIAVAKLKTLDQIRLQAIRELKHIVCPTLIIQAKLDNKVHPASTELVQKEIAASDVSLIMLEHSPHGCTYSDERDLAAEYCADFVNHVLRQNSLH